MANNRVYWPINYVAIGPYCSASGTPVHGVQSVTTTTTFNLEQVFELGQLEIYENIENLPNIEMTIEKALDGYPLAYHLATRGSTTPTLNNRTNQRSDVFLAVFSDAQDNASGQPLTVGYCSGMYVNSIQYSIPVEGNATETLTLVGNDKIWVQGSGSVWYHRTGFPFDGHFDGTDSPLDAIQRRQNVVMGAAPTGSIWPSNIPGITVVNSSGYNQQTAGVYDAHIQNVTVSTNLGRTDLFELGRRKPYYRYANFPTPVDCSIDVTTGGDVPDDNVDANSDIDNLTNEAIVVKLSDSTQINLGTKNKLQSVTFNAGATAGGVSSLTYAFQNFNVMSVSHNQDPEGL